MAASRADISRWFDEGVANKATHLLVVCDTFDWDDYPVYVKGGAEEARKLADEYRQGRKSMQKLMEIYHLASDKEAQLAADVQAMNIEPLKPDPAPEPDAPLDKHGRPIKRKVKGTKGQSKLADLVERHKRPKGKPALTLIEGGKKS
jgi:hypothetical protein